MSRLLTYGIMQQFKNIKFLDIYTGAAFAFSLRKLRSGYSGYCIKVRRSSDNSEQDIGFLFGVLDEVSLTTFCGAGDGFVKTWYDQSGNGRDVTNSTTSGQPKIVDAGNVIKQGNKPFLYFNSSGLSGSSSYAFSNFLDENYKNTILIVMKEEANINSDLCVLHIGNASTGQPRLGIYPGYTEIGIPSYSYIYDSGNSTSRRSIYVEETFINVFKILFNVSDGNFADIYINESVRKSTAISGDVTLTGYFSISLSNYIDNYKGYISEVIQYPFDRGMDMIKMKLNLNNFYSIYSKQNDVIYDKDKSILYYGKKPNAGTLIIPITLSEVKIGALYGCNGFSSILIPEGYDSDIYPDFLFADFSGVSLDAAILNLADGELGSEKYFSISSQGLINLLTYNPDAVTEALARYINIVTFPLTGLVSFWQLEEASGTSVNDTYGNVTGTSANCTLDQSGIIGKAYSFNGTSSKITFADVGLTTFSISLWYYIATGHGNANYDRVFGMTGYRFELAVFSTGFAIYDGAWHTGLGSFTLDSWNHIVIAKDSTEYALYVNGSAVYRLTKTLTINSTDDLIIGADYNGTSNIKGLFDQISYYNIKLNSVMVEMLYNSGNGI